MDLLDIIKENEDAMIKKLRSLETIEYRKNNSIEKISKEKKFATIILKSILQRKQEVINELTRTKY
jgi:hypothetical protein